MTHNAKKTSHKRKGGRPKLPPADLRHMTLGVRVSDNEYQVIQEKADRLNMTPTQFLRAAAILRQLPPPPVPAINREQYTKLSRLSSNFNQLLKALHEIRKNPYQLKVNPQKLETTLSEILLTIKELQKEVNLLRLELVTQKDNDRENKQEH